MLTMKEWSIVDALADDINKYYLRSFNGREYEFLRALYERLTKIMSSPSNNRCEETFVMPDSVLIRAVRDFSERPNKIALTTEQIERILR